MFRLRARDLLSLTGDRGARVLSAGVVELPAARRSADFVIRLCRGSEVYLRHVEFESRNARGLALRLFEYATRLAAYYRLPVLTTVVFLRPAAPRALAYRERLCGRVVHERRFEVLHLREIEPARLLGLGPGAAALVGTTARVTLPQITAAAGLILAQAPAGQRADLLAILQVLSERGYTSRQLADAIPQEVVMGSSLFAKVKRLARAEGEARGEVRGRREGARQICTRIARRHHPAIAERVIPLIESCTSLRRLQGWAVDAPQLSDAAFLQLVSGSEAKLAATRGSDAKPAAARQRRAPRPARRATARRG